MAISDFFFYLRTRARLPRHVTSNLPSRQQLASRINRHISRNCRQRMDIGPGTGVFSQALLVRGIPETDLAAVGSGRNFVQRLRTRFPYAQVLWLDFRKPAKKGEHDDINSSTTRRGAGSRPLREEQIRTILQAIFYYFAPTGALLMFTYGPSPLVSKELLDELDLSVTRIGHIAPLAAPATVYRITRKAPDSASTPCHSTTSIH